MAVVNYSGYFISVRECHLLPEIIFIPALAPPLCPLLVPVGAGQGWAPGLRGRALHLAVLKLRLVRVGVGEGAGCIVNI